MDSFFRISDPAALVGRGTAAAEREGPHAVSRLRSGVYESVEQLEASIRDFIALHNEREAKPF